jgi:hypothetical protein
MQVASSAPVDSTPTVVDVDKTIGGDVTTQVDSSVQSLERGTKRAAAEDPEVNGHKKARTGTFLVD